VRSVSIAGSRARSADLATRETFMFFGASTYPLQRGEVCVRKVMLLLSWLLPIALSGLAWADEKSDDVIAGTYDIRLCQGPCSFTDTTNVAAQGTLILFAKPLEKADLDRFNERRFWHTTGEPVNGCYTLERINGSKIVIGDVGVTSWSWNEGKYDLALFRSPDAGYAVTVERTPTGLSGSGHFWGAGVAAPETPTQEIVVARRTGPADIANCTFATAEETEFSRLLADPAREEIFSIDKTYREKLVADLESSDKPRDWAMGGWIQFGDKGDASILRALKAAPHDRLIQWMSMLRERTFSAPVWINGAQGYSVEEKELDESALASLSRAEPDNAFAWLFAVRDAAGRKDDKAIDAALAHVASSKYYDDHAADILKAQIELFRSHPLPDAYFAAVARLDPGWGIHGSFSKDTAPYYENRYPFADLGVRNVFNVTSDIGGRALYVACTQPSQRSPARTDACMKAARVLAAHARRVSERNTGSLLLNDMSVFTADDIARARAQVWMETQYESIHPRSGMNGRPYMQDDIAFANDWLETSDENEAMRRAVLRAGKTLAPPDDFALNERLYRNFESAYRKSRAAN